MLKLSHQLTQTKHIDSNYMGILGIPGMVQMGGTISSQLPSLKSGDHFKWIITWNCPTNRGTTALKLRVAGYNLII